MRKKSKNIANEGNEKLLLQENNSEPNKQWQKNESITPGRKKLERVSVVCVCVCVCEVQRKRESV